MTPSEDSILNALIEFIQNRTDQAKESLVSSLSQYLSTSFFMGYDRAGQEIGMPSAPLGSQALDPIIAKLGPHLDQTFGALGDELIDVIKGGVKEGLSYPKIQEALTEKIRAGWGQRITFDNTGKVRKIVNVAPDGTLSWAKQTISRKVTLPADVYAETLARTTVKQAYAGGHFARYEEAGYPGWVYISVADERTRPKHLALHGRTFFFGTEEEKMAREVMAEYSCRCRPKAFFDDPKLDRPYEEYREERRTWARKALDEPESELLNDEKKKYLEVLAGDDKQEEVKFKLSKTIQEAENWIKNSTNIRQVDYKGLNLEIANEANLSLTQHLNLDRRLESNMEFIGTAQAQTALEYQQRLAARMETIRKLYPEMNPSEVRRIAEYHVVKSKVPGNTWAWFGKTPNCAGIGINKKWGSDPVKLKESLQRNINNGFHPVGCDSIKSLIDHEFGHALDDLYKFSDTDEIILQYKTFCRQGNDMAGGTLSIYAMKNRREFIAEAWAEYLNNPKPRPVAKQVGSMMERMIKEAKKK